jgi:hypothetical protein
MTTPTNTTPGSDAVQQTYTPTADEEDYTGDIPRRSMRGKHARPP